MSSRLGVHTKGLRVALEGDTGSQQGFVRLYWEYSELSYRPVGLV